MDKITQIRRRLYLLDYIVKDNLGYIEKRSEDSPGRFYNFIFNLSILVFYYKLDELDWFKGTTEGELKKIVGPYFESKYKSMIMKRWEDYMSSKGKN